MSLPRCSLGVALALLAGLLPVTPVAAQTPDGFLFRSPKVTLGVRMGYGLATASSEIFDFTREQLTVDRSDFSGWFWGGEVGIRASDRVDIAISLGVIDSEIPSEMRDWVGVDDLPIQQTTMYQRVPLTVGVKAYLRDRGRSIGRFA